MANSIQKKLRATQALSYFILNDQNQNLFLLGLYDLYRRLLLLSVLLFSQQFSFLGNSDSFKALIALKPSVSSSISTKPKHLELPVSLSIITLAEETEPCSEKRACKSSLVVVELNFATKIFTIKIIKIIIHIEGYVEVYLWFQR